VALAWGVASVTTRVVLFASCAAAACSQPGTPPASDAKPGVVFAYPVDKQVDVPVGTNVVVSFSEQIDPSQLGQCQLVGPAGPVTATAQATPDGAGVLFPAPSLDPGTTYQVQLPAAIDPAAQNLMSPLLSFTTRTARPRAAAPTLVAVNGGDPANPESFRPMLDTSTIRLLFSEPLDSRSIGYGPGAIELVDASGSDVPATVVSDGIHVAVDPVADLTGGASYTLKLGASLVDLGGQPLAPTTVALTPHDTKGTSGGSMQVLRTRTSNDPTIPSRAGVTPNQVIINKPLIGTETQTLLPAALANELGDPAALGGPIAFTVRKGQRLAISGLTVQLGGQIPVGVSTGDITIEFLTDGGGRIFRNPNQSPDLNPDDGSRAPLYADLSFDVAIFAKDPTGNAVLTQTVMGVQAAGTVTIADGALSIETASSMELGLLGVTEAPSNLALSLITDSTATVPTHSDPPTLVATSPSSSTDLLPVDAGIELIFSEPVDLDRLRAGGLTLQTAAGGTVPAVIESHGAAIVVRPLQSLAFSNSYQVALTDVADVAGNQMAAMAPIPFTTPPLASTSSPLSVSAVYPGVPCALSNGHCAGGQSSDDTYSAFTLPADQDVIVQFTQPPTATTLQLGSACGTGSVRVEQLDASGACVAPVAGTLLVHATDLRFVADAPWVPGTSYQLTLVSDPNQNCNAGEVCGMNGNSASFDPLNGTQGTGASGGPNLVIPFTAAMPSNQTFMVTQALPFADINGDGAVDGNEAINDSNRAGLTIQGTSGIVSSASFSNPRCPQSATSGEDCMFLSGAMPVELGDVQAGCALPDGTTAACVPVTLSPQGMYGTTVTLSAKVVININSATGTSVMRIREPSGGGPIMGYIVAGSGGTPQMQVALDLYLDAPDLSLPASSHDLHSKPLSVVLAGPVTVQSDGRMAIAASNIADVPLTVNITAIGVASGSVKMTLPAGEMKLQLVSPLLRGAAQ
jgi:hypothetical protein